MTRFLTKIGAVFSVLLLLAGLVPTHAGAYSYGDPNEEQVADIYKKMVAKLNQSPPDFDGAKSLFDPIKPELDMHMGTDASASVLNNIQAKNKDATIRDMQKVLVLNIARRLESIEKDFQNYKQTKLLIAKANATYEALSPTVKQKDAQLDETLRGEFQKSLESLGNPGLFGVGVKEPDPKTFKDSKDKILSSLQKQFDIQSLEVGHFNQGAGPGNEQNAKKQVGSDFSDPKNWIPIVLIVAALAAIVLVTRRRKRK
jgi:hypothetical protein